MIKRAFIAPKVGVLLGEGVGEGVGVAVEVVVRDAVDVAVGEDVNVTVKVSVDVAVAVAVGLSVGVGVGLAVSEVVGDGVGVSVGVRVMTAETEPRRERERERERKRERERGFHSGLFREQKGVKRSPPPTPSTSEALTGFTRIPHLTFPFLIRRRTISLNSCSRSVHPATVRLPKMTLGRSNAFQEPYICRKEGHLPPKTSYVGKVRWPF